MQSKLNRTSWWFLFDGRTRISLVFFFMQKHPEYLTFICCVRSLEHLIHTFGFCCCLQLKNHFELSSDMLPKDINQPSIQWLSKGENLETVLNRNLSLSYLKSPNKASREFVFVEMERFVLDNVKLRDKHMNIQTNVSQSKQLWG